LRLCCSFNMYDQEFPALARVTNNMESKLMLEVSRNLEQYSVEVRTDYARWTQYRKEYSDWLRKQAQGDWCEKGKEGIKNEFY